MEDDDKYNEIQKEIKSLNDSYNTAITEEDWQIWNTQLNKVGEMIEKYGRMQYTRNKKMNLILGLQEANE